MPASRLPLPVTRAALTRLMPERCSRKNRDLLTVNDHMNINRLFRCNTCYALTIIPGSGNNTSATISVILVVGW